MNEKDAQIIALTEERDRQYEENVNQIMKVAKLEEQIAALREAFRPFMEMLETLETPEQWEAWCERTGMVISFPAEDSDSLSDWKNNLTIGHLRRLCAVLAATEPKGDAK